MSTATAEVAQEGATLTTDTSATVESAPDASPSDSVEQPSVTAEAKRTARRPPPTGAELTALAKKAKADFARQYQGAHLSIPTQLRNHTIVTAYNRMWSPVLRNWNVSMTVLRSVMSDGAAAARVEQQLLNLLTKVSGQIETKAKQLDHVLSENDMAAMAFTSLSYQNPVNESVVLLGPVAFKFRAVLMAADSLLDKGMVAYTIGEMSSEEFEKLKWEIKRQLKSIDSLARNLRSAALQQSRDAGLARPGYKAKTEEPEAELTT